ncbi:MAG: serine hydrolase domain-containing protein, partial [Flavitalea sp.]
MMRNTVLIFTLLVSFAASAQTEQQKMDELMNAYTSMYKFNGTVLVAKKGKVLFSKGYGYRISKDSAKNTPNTIYQIGSITKQFTSAIILKLQEQRKLNIDDKISKYFPGYPKGDSITIKNLLTHTSGIFNYTENQKFMQATMSKVVSKDSLMAQFRDVPLNFSPGTKYSYSNSGYVLLGLIIEKITGKPYETVIREQIFGPLKMTNSGFDFKNLKSDDKAAGYSIYKQSIKMTAVIADSTTSYSAGAIFSTTGDLLKWHNALQSTKLLSKQSLQQAYAPLLEKYALGWAVDTIFGQQTVMHGGGIFGFNTNIQRLPGDDVVVVLLCNMNIGGLEQISRNLLSIVYERPYEIPREKTAIRVDENILQQYVG